MTSHHSNQTEQIFELPVLSGSWWNEMIEVIGEDKIRKGSFLDLEEDWREIVKEFKDRRLAQGHAFKSTLKSAEELARVNEDSLHEAFHVVLDGDEW